MATDTTPATPNPGWKGKIVRSNKEGEWVTEDRKGGGTTDPVGMSAKEIGKKKTETEEKEGVGVHGNNENKNIKPNGVFTNIQVIGPEKS